MRDLHLRFLALTLAVAGLSLAWYKVDRLGLPLTPDEQAPVWTVEARVSFRASGGSCKAALDIPKNPPGFRIIDEDFISGTFGLAIDGGGPGRQAQWAVRRASGRQTLYYRVSLYEDASANDIGNGATPRFPERPEYPEPQRGAIETVLEAVRAASADISSFARELLIRLNTDVDDENVALLRKQASSPAEWVAQIGDILAGARIPTRVLWGLHLRDGARELELEPWLQVHDGARWLSFDPRSGRRGLPSQFLVWKVGDGPILDVTRATSSAVEFSSASRVSDLVAVAQQRARALGSRVMEFSLFSLPVSVQNVYRVLLLVPLGVALLVVLRNVVGLKTFGTFMPILIGLAFRETRLLWGVTLFALVVSLGLLIRFYFERLKLLLVPRLASVVIVVVLLMLAISIVSHRLGLEQGLSISLFPMVIIAMTIERMSIVWDEHGARDAITQGLGSVAAACGAYLVMQDATLRYLVFVFPELLLVVLAATLLMGRYKGYRLTELWRFRALIFPGRQG